MTVSKDEIIIIKKTDEMDVTSEYLAKKRILFEYPREGYGEYDETHINKIKIGILGELAFLEYFLNFLKEKYGSIKPIKRWNILHSKVGFSYLIMIGKFDGGHEFRIGKKNSIKIDIKTYEQNQVSINQIFYGLKEDIKKPQPLNLFIDKDQYTKADIYIQTFILNDGNIALAGYNVGLPPLATWMPKPAYTKTIPELENMNTLTKKIKDMCDLEY